MLQKPLKSLAWNNGDLFDNVKSLRDKLNAIQKRIDLEPYNKIIREEESPIIKSYEEAMKEEEKLLYQKDKIKWLRMGDRNNAFFHKALKSIYNRNQEFQEVFGYVLNDDKMAPGPDCYTSHFFKKAWNIIGDDIQDNILISQELLKGYDRKNGHKRAALKIDLRKAYDTVNWRFLGDILKGFGFHDAMTNWIIKCVTDMYGYCILHRKEPNNGNNEEPREA
ncbi:RNA-directed DNA polymerase, eukaryota, reverse transcriptase zinc-binding domain protein [Tanacetum coccineum]